MKPEIINADAGKVKSALEARAEANQRAESWSTLSRERSKIITRAKVAIGSVHKLQKIHQSDRSAVVILERREDDKAGVYMVVGRIAIQGTDHRGAHSNESYNPDREQAMVELGIAFPDKSAVKNSEESLLGSTIADRDTYGVWTDEESTEEVMEAIRNLKNNDLGGVTFQGVAHRAHLKLQSIDGSIGIIVQAAQDEDLNPQSAAKVGARA